MAVDLQTILESEQAAGLRRQGDASSNFLAMLDRKVMQIITEADPLEAASAAQLISKAPTSQPTPSSGNG